MVYGEDGLEVKSGRVEMGSRLWGWTGGAAERVAEDTYGNAYV